MTIGEKIKELRTLKSLSQREVGAAVSQDAAYISNVEKGRKALSENHIGPLALLLGGDEKELKTLWLGEKLYRVVGDDELAPEAFRVAEELHEYHKKKKP